MKTKDAQTIELKRMGFQFDLKQVSDEGHFEGYASTRSVDRGGDIVEAGAFDKSLEAYRAKGKMPKMLFQHDPNKVIGVWESMAEDDKGLFVKGRVLTDITLGKDLNVLMKAGAIDTMSIGYRTIDDEFEGRVRRLKEVELWEVSLVTFPMQPEAEITNVKRLDSKGDVERILREAGVSGKFAKLVALYGYEEARKRVGGRREADNSLQKALDNLSATLKRNSERNHA